MKKIKVFLAAGCFAAINASSQLKIDNATFFISAGATVTVQGDMTSNVDIQGTGLLQLKSTTLQNVDMGGFTIPNLEIDNTANVALKSNARIGTSLLFTNGKIQTGNLNLILGPSAVTTGANSTRFVWINGSGQLIKQLAGDIADFELPVGENTNYRPAYLTTSGSAYSSANVGVRVLAGADINRPPMIANYLNTSWPVTRTGITGGTVTLGGQYIDPSDVSGTEANLLGYYFNGTDWSSLGSTNNTATNRAAAQIASATGVLYGMNKFITVGTQAFLQGVYDPALGLMNDGLRTPTNLIPSGDPYRTAAYNTVFTHIANATAEVAPPSVFLNQVSTNDNIVDWVFLQLRDLTAGSGNVILQTRSALIQRDGDIVDIDGVSPVTFNNIADGNYIIAVRHRNHLGLSFDQSTGFKFMTEAKSTAFSSRVFDLRTAIDADLYGTGTAYTTGVHPSLPGNTANLLWAGNVSGNGFVRYQGSNGPTGPNDRVVLLQDIGGGETTVLSNYQRGDLNFNRFTRYQGSNGPPPAGLNDRLFLLQQVLANSEITVRSQGLQN